MATAETKEDIVLASFATLSILQLIKDAQQKHGLRHGDYQRYRGYCARRVRRIRKSLGFTHIHKSVPKHPAKFNQRKIAFDVVTEERYLQVAVFDAERNWSYAMQLKQEIGEDIHSRKRFHMASKLRKAVKHTNNLESIVRMCDRADAATKLEAQAYNAWMTGCFYFEMKQWKKALDFLKTARTIYEKLADVVKFPELIDLYKARCREIQPQMRYCEFNCGDDADTDAAVSEMINMRLQLGDGEGSLQDDFDKLISEMRTKATLDAECYIRWAGESIAVKNDSIKQLIQAVEQFDAQLKQTASHDDKIALYEQLLGSIRDVMQSWNEEMKKAGGGGATRNDSVASSAQLIAAYLDFIRLTKTIERYLLIVSHTRAQTEKKVKPQDLLRLYDSVIEDCNEILRLPGASSNEQIKSAFLAKIEYYRAFRCYYMAEAYANLSKWQDAVALYDRAIQRCSSALKAVNNSKHSAYLQESEDELTDLMKQITSAKYTTQANRLAEAAGERAEEENTNVADTRPLIETLDEYRKIDPEELLKSEPNVCIVMMPPQFIPMPNKPMFFDLALNHIKMPDLETKIASFGANERKNTSKQQGDSGKKAKGGERAVPEQEQGIGGMVKGWFWGKK
uniref:Signal recognition particle subunit SRP68 n=2 Tax=Parascaris univalens TaxID=6257 RepID=A0A915AU48_PARUN